MNPAVEFVSEPSLRARQTAAALRVAVRPLLTHWPLSKPWLRPVAAVEQLAVMLPVPRGTRVRPVRFDGFQAEWVRAPEAGPWAGPRAERVILYFHGGGFFSCGLRTHRRMISQISAAAEAPVLSVAYRKLPDVGLRESIADCVAAYRWLLEQGHPAESIIVAGDSAGGFLSFAAPLSAMEQGLPSPGGIVAMAPWADLDHTTKLMHENAILDAYLPAGRLERLAELLAEEALPLDPMLSPVNASLGGLPPVLIQVGSTEMLLADAELMAERLAAAGVPCRLQIWEGQVHDFQLLADLIPEGLRAIQHVGDFVRDMTERSSDIAA